MTLTTETLALIDDRVRRALKRPQRAGTLMTRATDITGTLVEDGGTTAMDCLIAGDLLVEPGDRIVFVQFGSDWVVLGGLTPRFPPEVGWTYNMTGESSGGVFIDMPGLPAPEDRILVKRSDASRLKTQFEAVLFFDSAPKVAGFGLKLTDVDTGVANTTLVIHTYQFQQANAYENLARTNWLDGIAAGRYYVAPQWGNVTGGGSLNSNGQCSYSFTVSETAPLGG